MKYAKFENSDVSYLDDPAWLKQLSLFDKLTCPNCGKKVSYVVRRRGQNHFKHQRGVVGEDGCELYAPGSESAIGPDGYQAYGAINSFPTIGDFTPRIHGDTRFSTVLSIHTSFLEDVYFKLNIEWLGESGKDSFLVHTASGHRTEVNLGAKLLKSSFIVDPRKAILSWIDLKKPEIEKHLLSFTKFISEHRYLIQCEPKEKEIIGDNYFVRKHVLSIYDKEMDEVLFPPQDDKIFDELILDGYVEVEPSNPISISSRDIKQLIFSGLFIGLSSFESISIKGNLSDSTNLIVTFFNVDGSIYTKRTINVSKETENFDFSIPGVDRLQIECAGAIFNLFICSEFTLMENEIVRYYPREHYNYIIRDGRSTFLSRFSDNSWVFEEKVVENSGLKKLDSMISKRLWDDKLLGVDYLRAFYE
ncbi:hypothetical protein ACIMS2_002338 [Vibrio harveyi]